MQAYQGVVRQGRIQITPPAELPEGSEVYVVVTGQPVRLTAVAGVLHVSPDRPAMEREQEAFRQMLPELLNRYRDQYVAVYQGQVIDHDRDQTALVMRLDQTHPEAAVLVKRVTAEPERVLRMPSPRLSRDG